MKDSLLIIAHRGASGYEPENTLRSFARAIELGADMIELDVQLCRTGELVVIHDDTVDRTTNGHGWVAELSLEELRQLDAGLGERIPTLAEVFDLVDRRVPINVELKSPGVAKPVSKLIATYRTKGWDADRFMVSSFDHPELLRFHKLQPNIRIGALYETIPSDYFTTLDALGAWSINVSLKAVNRALVEAVHQRGLKIFVYTVNEASDIKNMSALGVDGIFTNFPDRARQVLS